MKKVLALVLAVLMLATVAFAIPIANITPGTKVKISKEQIWDSGDAAHGMLKITADTEQGATVDFASAGIEDYILRSVTTENYSVSNVKIQKVGKSLVDGVSINDKEERVEVKIKDDLNNQTAKDFEVSFKLKGKAKFTIRDTTELNKYKAICPTAKVSTASVGSKVTLPDLEFTVSGTVGYGKVEIALGDDGDEEIEDLENMGVNLEDDVVKFKKGGVVGTSKRIAGAYVADAILTQEYGDAMTLEARVYHNDVLYFNCENDPDRDIIGRLADSDADMDFYCFNSDKNFTTFNSNVKMYFNDAEEEDFIYQIKDGKLVKIGDWSEDDDCWVVKTRTLGQYVVSDVELTEFEAAAGTVDENPDTGANDVVGIATALAAVALVSAAAVSLKK